ncbi:Sterile alpha motif domain-containing protein putative isoform 3 [Tripterygium wilfordii]|uniref:Sterile alpha motif domain-containing protein putative isoform 3 n=1 Tax=Tripterygium wilfordii TaxID=458696 RepID=A0A7J7DJV6_TRIWF|nr:Sterile alpha motif domain-containing protein putative isoform 3 [Tripterygium wilfordii]
MSGNSRDRVTITLGRSGQVVKRAVSDVDYSNSMPNSGSKRSLRERLGSNLDDSLARGNQISNKRHRGDGSLMSWNGKGGDERIGKDDLRFKLMQKNVFRRGHTDDDDQKIDLREKLSRIQHPSNNLDTRKSMPESRETSIMGRIPESRETSIIGRIPESRETSIMGRIPPRRSADDLPRMDSSRNSYPVWTLDHLRQRSSDQIVGTSRGLSPPRSVEDLRRRPSRAYDDVRAVPYMRKDIIDAPRPVNSSALLTKPTMPMVDEQHTVDGLLHTLGLGKYAILFKAEEVDMTALKQMGENDLKELGIPMVSFLLFSTRVHVW